MIGTHYCRVIRGGGGISCRGVGRMNLIKTVY